MSEVSEAVRLTEISRYQDNKKQERIKFLGLDGVPSTFQNVLIKPHVFPGARYRFWEEAKPNGESQQFLEKRQPSGSGNDLITIADLKRSLPDAYFLNEMKIVDKNGKLLDLHKFVGKNERLDIYQSPIALGASLYHRQKNIEPNFILLGSEYSDDNNLTLTTFLHEWSHQNSTSELQANDEIIKKLVTLQQQGYNFQDYQERTSFRNWPANLVINYASHWGRESEVSQQVLNECAQIISRRSPPKNIATTAIEKIRFALSWAEGMHIRNRIVDKTSTM